MAGVALVFPGQGAQSIGMGRDLYEGNPAARDVLEEADRVLGFGLLDLCFSGPAEELGATVNAQPAILAVSVATLRALLGSLGSSFRPALLSGHSLGEYTALAASGALSFGDALRLVRERGRLMQAAGETAPGAMSAIIGLAEDVVERVCREVSPVGIAVIANYNAPDQFVVSGERQAVSAVGELARAAGARRVVPLAVSGAFHSPLMEPAAAEFGRIVARADLRDSVIPVVGNAKPGLLVRSADIRAELISQLCASVRWVDGVRRMRDAGVELFVEVGPGQVLSGLIRRIVPGARTLSVSSAEDITRAGAVVGALPV